MGVVGGGGRKGGRGWGAGWVGRVEEDTDEAETCPLNLPHKKHKERVH